MVVDVDRCAAACSTLLRAASESAMSGPIADYFAKQGRWEETMRDRFAYVRDGIYRGLDVRADATLLFTQLNAWYNTRFAKAHHLLASQILLDELSPELAQLSLSQLNPDEVRKTAAVAKNILQKGIANGISKRPHSRVTKYLQFLHPDLFAIYDAQAANSIWMWSLFAIGSEHIALDALNRGVRLGGYVVRDMPWCKSRGLQADAAHDPNGLPKLLAVSSKRRPFRGRPLITTDQGNLPSRG